MDASLHANVGHWVLVVSAVHTGVPCPLLRRRETTKAQLDALKVLVGKGIKARVKIQKEALFA